MVVVESASGARDSKRRTRAHRLDNGSCTFFLLHFPLVQINPEEKKDASSSSPSYHQSIPLAVVPMTAVDLKGGEGTSI